MVLKRKHFTYVNGSCWTNKPKQAWETERDEILRKKERKSEIPRPLA